MSRRATQFTFIQFQYTSRFKRSEEWQADIPKKCSRPSLIAHRERSMKLLDHIP